MLSFCLDSTSISYRRHRLQSRAEGIVEGLWNFTHGLPSPSSPLGAFALNWLFENFPNKPGMEYAALLGTTLCGIQQICGNPHVEL